MKQNNMLAMILAGGRGSRLHDLTKKVAKPAVSYGGKYRIIDFPLSNCANSGIDVVGRTDSVRIRPAEQLCSRRKKMGSGYQRQRRIYSATTGKSRCKPGRIQRNCGCYFSEH